MLASMRRLWAALTRQRPVEADVAVTGPGRRWRVRAVRDDGRSIELQNHGIFDELVVDDWLHLEQMDDNAWWLQVGDVRIWVSVKAGEPPIVDVERGAYGDVRGETRTWDAEAFKDGLR
ncbi:hypothetical protein SSBR45G_29920 [Bradyrhizobium sp. SSBR45G]|uniref:hypothetical protein n=1 Tax=unclassified Bradyrhizobium TaxID=2631580 RepID=UPI002342B39B|nr:MULTISPECIES: hypothetical protein [unclassified Bradyrhizobium]GLH78084.1 hypothetical protein SSBR45G_29920 [Bradyrhizobium sp. SSBR45G]GLH87982.1 hypothetical protein SSBR45R_54420 [Bradyrhizobium sp. SSBR45R]